MYLYIDMKLKTIFQILMDETFSTLTSISQKRRNMNNNNSIYL